MYNNNIKQSYSAYLKAAAASAFTRGTFLFAKTTGVLPTGWFGGESENSNEIKADIISETALQKRESFHSNALQSNLQLFDDSPTQEELIITQSYQIHKKRGLSNATQSSLIEGVEVGQFNFSNMNYDYIRQLAVQGNYAFLAQGFSGLITLDISNGSNPILVGGYNPGRLAYQVTLSSGYAFVANNFAFDIFNVSDLNNITLTVNLAMPNLEWKRKVAVVNDTAYVIDTNNGQFNLLNVSNLSDPLIFEG